jgi:hypothetical protein
MIIPDYEASKKQYHSVEEEYLVHGNHPLFYFPPELSCWKAEPVMDEPLDQEHDRKSIRFGGMSSFEHLRHDR